MINAPEPALSTADSPLTTSAVRLRRWCVERALPIWAERGQRADGSWVEHLHANGTPDLGAERRWRVMARQVYSYAEATRAGWLDGQAVAETTYDRMVQIGPVHRVAANGRLTDSTRDLYDLAFYVLAAASLYGVTGQARHLKQAEDWLLWMDETLAHPDGGWRETESSQTCDPRRQNPHMHLLEASLYLFGVTNHPKHLAVARRVFKLFEAHFFHEGTIREFFNAEWSVTAGAKGETVEPGHAMEWVWLLGEYNRATGTDTTHYRYISDTGGPLARSDQCVSRQCCDDHSGQHTLSHHRHGSCRRAYIRSGRLGNAPTYFANTSIRIRRTSIYLGSAVRPGQTEKKSRRSPTPFGTPGVNSNT